MAENDTSLPPVTFEFFTASLKMQTEMHLGLIHFGEPDEEVKPDFRLARHSIELLALMQEKTKGNLTVEEQRFLENTLTELRFRYVQAMEKSKRSEQPAASVEEPAGSGEEKAAG